MLAWIFLAVCCLLLSKQKENGDLQYERDMTQHMLTAQHDYFTMLLEKEQETKAFRHDVKEHILCMMSLCEEGKYEELCRYLCYSALYMEAFSSHYFSTFFLSYNISIRLFSTVSSD